MTKSIIRLIEILIKKIKIKNGSLD